VQYKQLTILEKQQLRDLGILNGCGPASWKGKAPDFFFEACCFEHDYNYEIGGTEADRRKYDYGFYQAMRRDVSRLAWYNRIWGNCVAWVFYRFVKWKGGSFYTYRDQPFDGSVEELIADWRHRQC